MGGGPALDLGPGSAVLSTGHAADSARGTQVALAGGWLTQHGSAGRAAFYTCFGW